MSQQVKICPLRMLARAFSRKPLVFQPEGDNPDKTLRESLGCLEESCVWFISERPYRTCVLADIAYSLNVLAEDSRLGPK